MLQTKKLNLTEGSVTKAIFVFVIPVMIGTLLQNFFNMADKIVLGQMAGTDAVASVGACSVVVTLIVQLFVGLSGGVTIVISRAFGEGDTEKTRRIISTALISSVILGMIASAIGLSTGRLFLNLTDCPESCLEGALLYMSIYFFAAPFIVLYNFGAAILRSYGDSRRPTNYLVIGGAVNVVLNIALCFLLEQKVAAVAIATFASQAVAAVLTFLRILHMEEDFRFDFRRIVFDMKSFGKILRYGIPAAINASLYPLSNLQIQSAVNSFGSAATAGQSASESITGILAAIEVGFAQAASAMVGQNLGAKNPQRVRKSFWMNAVYAALLTGAVSVLILCFRVPLLRLFVPDNADAVGYGVTRIRYVGAWFTLDAVTGVLANTLNAFGYSSFVAVSSLVSTVVFRPIWMSLVYPHYSSYACIMVCYIVSWSMCFLFCAAFLSVILARYRKGKYRKV